MGRGGGCAPNTAGNAPVRARVKMSERGRQTETGTETETETEMRWGERQRERARQSVRARVKMPVIDKRPRCLCACSEKMVPCGRRGVRLTGGGGRYCCVSVGGESRVAVRESSLQARARVRTCARKRAHARA